MNTIRYLGIVKFDLRWASGSLSAEEIASMHDADVDTIYSALFQLVDEGIAKQTGKNKFAYIHE